MNFDTWLIYLLAATGLSLSPGPNGLLALTHGALHGRRKTLCTVLGGALGFVAVIALSMFGIGALLQASVVWLMVMKWVGGAYLVWLGIQVWRSPPITFDASASVPRASGWSLFRQGALSAVTNPKGLLFFTAFLPQFIDPARSLWMQFAIRERPKTGAAGREKVAGDATIRVHAQPWGPKCASSSRFGLKAPTSRAQFL